MMTQIGLLLLVTLHRHKALS